MNLETITDDLLDELRPLKFDAPVTHVYNPLEYARTPYSQYLRRYAKPPREIVLIGMNPGPWGMAQTGIPFGEVSAVRQWLDIEAAVDPPKGMPVCAIPQGPGFIPISTISLGGFAKRRKYCE